MQPGCASRNLLRGNRRPLVFYVGGWTNSTESRFLLAERDGTPYCSPNFSGLRANTDRLRLDVGKVSFTICLGRRYFNFGAVRFNSQRKRTLLKSLKCL